MPLQTELPPAYEWSTREVVSFVVMAVALSLFIGGLSMADDGNTVLFAAGLVGNYYTWPHIWHRWLQYREVRRFRKELANHHE